MQMVPHMGSFRPMMPAFQPSLAMMNLSADQKGKGKATEQDFDAAFGDMENARAEAEAYSKALEEAMDRLRVEENSQKDGSQTQEGQSLSDFQKYFTSF
jgi:hypothetical protein